MSEENPYGKTAEEIDRSNRWFAVALALGKQDDFIKLLQTEGEVRAVTMTEQTRHDEHDRRWFNSGWEACRREVLAMAEHQGDSEAVKWAEEHPAH